MVDRQTHAGYCPETVKLGRHEVNTLKPDLCIDELLGVGLSGTAVVQGMQKQSKKHVAIKIIPKMSLSTAQIEEIRDVISMY